MPGLKRYLRTTPGGLLRVDMTKISAEENLDGKFLLRGPGRLLRQRTELTALQQEILTALGLPEPRRVHEARPSTP
jgi:hypothetical protein